MRIGMFATCVADTMFPEAAHATATILERLGHEVIVPREQTCCGQMHMNSGYRREALPLAEHFLATFGGFDAVVAPSSSCVGAIRELYPQLLDIEHPVIERTMELSEFLVHRLGVEDVGASYPHRVTYHPTCHSLRVARIGDAAAAVAQRQGTRARRAAQCRGVLRVRRHVLDQERGHV
jgi:L-lactate dehydrogenase complex protein LldE